MKELVRHVLLAVGILMGFCVTPAPACILCNGGKAQTIRQEAAQARLVLYGTLENPRVTGDNGKTDLRVQAVVKTDNSYKVTPGQVVVVPHYLPVDPKNPVHFLVFCDVFHGKLDPYRGLPLKAKDSLDYVKGALALDPKDRTAALLYCFPYLEDSDPELASDAYGEFAKADNQEVGAAASRLAPERLRQWVKDPRTPVERLSLYSFLLGACGGDADAALLKSMLEKTDERTTTSLNGILAGYIQLRPREGWALLLKLIGDEKKPFVVRYAILRTLQFYHAWKPDETRAPVLRALASALPEGDLADLAVEDLRRWQAWDLTRDVLAVYGRKTHSAPIMKRAILRYALCCPRPEAAAFIAERRREDPATVKDVEDSLRYEKAK
jgi:hypothetical protein